MVILLLDKTFLYCTINNILFEYHLYFRKSAHNVRVVEKLLRMPIPDLSIKMLLHKFDHTKCWINYLWIQILLSKLMQIVAENWAKIIQISAKNHWEFNWNDANWPNVGKGPNWWKAKGSLNAHLTMSD